MTEPASIGWRPGMFAGAVQCKCGFATSNTDLYECPACDAVWRKRPTGPVCSSCQQEMPSGSAAHITDSGIICDGCHVKSLEQAAEDAWDDAFQRRLDADEPTEAAVEAVDEQTDGPEGDDTGENQ